MSVLIFAGGRDPEAARVRKEVGDLGQSADWLDTASFPESLHLSIRDGDVYLEDGILRTPRSVYVRGLGVHPLSPAYSDELEERPRGLTAQLDEKRALLESVLLMARNNGAMLVNSIECNAQHSRKPLQLTMLEAAGVPIPGFLATNDPERVRAFASEYPACVYKPLAGGATVRRVEEKDLGGERLSALASAPVLFQELVEGVSVRAYVVDSEVAGAAEIHSKELDYRRGEQRVAVTELGPEEEEVVLGAANACGMAFTGVDFIRSAKGPSVLECNPSPMFAVFEEKTGLDIAGPLAGMLSRS